MKLTFSKYALFKIIALHAWLIAYQNGNRYSKRRNDSESAKILIEIKSFHGNEDCGNVTPVIERHIHHHSVRSHKHYGRAGYVNDQIIKIGRSPSSPGYCRMGSKPIYFFTYPIKMAFDVKKVIQESKACDDPPQTAPTMII